MPPNRNIIKVFEEVDSKGIDQASTHVRLVRGLLIERCNPLGRTLAN